MIGIVIYYSSINFLSPMSIFSFLGINGIGGEKNKVSQHFYISYS